MTGCDFTQVWLAQQWKTEWLAVLIIIPLTLERKNESKLSDCLYLIHQQICDWLNKQNTIKWLAALVMLTDWIYVTGCDFTPVMPGQRMTCSAMKKWMTGCANYHTCHAWTTKMNPNCLTVSMKFINKCSTGCTNKIITIIWLAALVMLPDWIYVTGCDFTQVWLAQQWKTGWLAALIIIPVTLEQQKWVQIVWLSVCNSSN